ncbi:GNAT family N-acetyltransferase [Shouchella lonarensis]|uniref:GNAT family N-acetyltransferase n=1 Tax=Shouchella lonarensis TaxID=1464122 RepID=UPI000B825D50|nr:GNAT family protein [Shouchella lonarensis]
MNLQTDRLSIRNFTYNDSVQLYEYTSLSEVMTYIPEGVFTKEMAKEFVEKQSCPKQATKFAVFLKGQPRLIGHIDFFKCFGEHTYEIGWVFHPEFYGQGFATEAAQAFVNYVFTYLKAHRIIATCQPENHPSYKIMEKIGMRREGFFKKCIPHEGGWWDEYFYAILREEF